MYPLLIFLSCYCLEFSFAFANITTTQFLRDPDTLVSSNSNFKLGFFTPTNSTKRYVGIWYNVQYSDISEVVVWVANRDTPIADSSGVLKISEDGNLNVIDGKKKVYWSSNVSYNATNPVAQLLDSGNLILLQNASATTIWQSFEHPTDSFLPPLKLTVDEDMYGKALTQSWRSPSDPSHGHFKLGVSGRNLTEAFIWNDDKPYWRSGPWTGNIFLGLPYMYSVGLNGFGLVDGHRHTFYITYTSPNSSVLQRYVMNYEGQLFFKEWDHGSGKWDILWQSFESECQMYGKCGPFASCNPRNTPICGCLKGFEPKNDLEWRKGNWKSGCIRRMPLQCGNTGGKADGFLMLNHMKVPDNAEWLSTGQDQDDCGGRCARDCSCVAYAFYSAIGCMFWNETLIDLQEFSKNGVDLFIRLAHSELGESRKWRTIVVVVVLIGSAMLVVSTYILWRWLIPRYGNRFTSNERLREKYIFKPSGSPTEELDLPLFEFEKLMNATNDFHHNNKLGEGGFGPVYKGKLDDGQELAVKRLSRASGQGLEEFMNEVVVISKLQHRNLVRLLGCCVKGEEKLLVYELLPNKSLDALLFDPVSQKLLDWEKRLNIINGICRGVLYLHRDSRLKIIHRDLKASNILLDEELNPKISDFGMARIFGGKQVQANTARVVGTYGYMSPEYAMEGRFSEKSDVFSLGLLLLEIVSGRRNSSFYDSECSGLLCYAWKLWNEDHINSLIDPTIFNPQYEADMLRCIWVGLLCVQELPEDRPSIPTVISMLDHEVTDLPRPLQPGFARRRNQSVSDGTLSEQESVNQVSITAISSR